MENAPSNNEASIGTSALDDGLCRLWGDPRPLQIDSYATGRPQAGMAYLIGDHISVEVTDGHSTWRGKIPIPPKWAP